LEYSGCDGTKGKSSGPNDMLDGSGIKFSTVQIIEGVSNCVGVSGGCRKGRISSIILLIYLFIYFM
jgi:hypothetical protein